MQVPSRFVRNHAGDGLWLVPALYVSGGIVLALFLGELDARAEALQDFPFLFSVGEDAARSLFATIATIMLTATTLVFSVTMLVLQLASGQFSPRVLRTYLRDPVARHTLGIFTCTFAYGLVAMAFTDTVEGARVRDGFALSAMGGMLLVLVSVGALIHYIHHTAQSIRVVNIIHAVTGDTRAAIDRLYPRPFGEAVASSAPQPAGTAAVVEAAREGYIVDVDAPTLVGIARARGVTIELVPRVGDFVAEGEPLAGVHGAGEVDAGLASAINDAVTLDRERTVDHDAAFGFRQLVDIAARALSPGVNDPATAVQTLDRIAALLRRLSGRAIPSPVRFVEDGELQLLLPAHDWPDFVHLALDEVIEYGSGSGQVRERLEQVLASLEAVAPGERQPEIARHRQELARLGDSAPAVHASAAR